LIELIEKPNKRKKEGKKERKKERKERQFFPGFCV